MRITSPGTLQPSLEPTDWEKLTLGACLAAPPRYGLNAAATSYRPGLPTYLRITDISPEGKFSPSPRVGVNSPNSDQYFLKDGDVVFARTGASVGKSYLHTVDNGELVFAGFLIQVRCNRAKLLPSFLRHFANTGTFWAWVATESSRTGQPGINATQLKSLEFLVPTISEQEKICTVLNNLEDHIDAFDTLIAKKLDIKQGAMQQLLTGKKRLPGFGVKETAQELLDVKKRLPVGWSEVKVSSVLRRVKDLPLSVATSDFLGRGLLPIVDQGKALVSGYTNDQNFQIDCPSGGYIVFGDHTRVVKFVNFNFATGADGTQVLEPKIPVNVKFISYSIQSREIPNTGYNRHFKYLAELEILVPGLEEQAAIARILSEMDAEIEALVAQREKTALIKIGMMQELLTGRTRLL